MGGRGAVSSDDATTFFATRRGRPASRGVSPRCASGRGGRGAECACYRDPVVPGESFEPRGLLLGVLCVAMWTASATSMASAQGRARADTGADVGRASVDAWRWPDAARESGRRLSRPPSSAERRPATRDDATRSESHSAPASHGAPESRSAPASRGPRDTQGAAAADSGSVRVRFAPEPRLLSLYRRDGPADQRLLCDGPCDLALPVGTHWLAVDDGVRGVRTLEHPLRLVEGGTLSVTYRARRHRRRLGGVVLAIGTVAAAVLLGMGVRASRCDGADPLGVCFQDVRRAALLGSAGVVFGVTAIAGGVLVSRRDRVSATFVPDR